MNKLPKIIVAGNCIVDLVFRGKAFESRVAKDRLSLAFGGKYLSDEFYEFFGGGGANASVTFSRQGFDVSLWAHVGNDFFGHLIINHLKKEKISTKIVKLKAQRTPLSCIILTPHGERTIITYRSNADNLCLNNDVLREMKKRHWFCIYSLPKLLQKDKLLFIKEAKANNLKVFLSLHGSEYAKGYAYLKPYFEKTDIFHLNDYECADIIGAKAHDLDFKKTNFSQKFKTPLLIVTAGRRGAYAYTQNEIYFQPIVPEKIRMDTTGAGDAFSSGFLVEYLRTDSIPKALYYGSKNATSEIEHLGSQTGLLKR